MLHLSLSIKHGKHRIESSWTVVSDEHRGAALIILSKDLGAASTSALSIKFTNQIITEIAVAAIDTRSSSLIFFRWFQLGQYL